MWIDLQEMFVYARKSAWISVSYLNGVLLTQWKNSSLCKKSLYVLTKQLHT